MSPEELGPLFVAPPETTHLWLRVVLLVVALPAIGILVAGLLRGQLGLGTAWAGVVVVPLFAFTLGHFVFMKDAKRVEFCGSCHVMQPVVAGLANDDESLAAVHFVWGALPGSEACYACHSGYGIWGGVRAKLEGARHMIRSAMGTERLPLQLYEPYDIRECMDCHGRTADFRDVDDHREPGTQAALVSREVGCTGECHPPAHPAAALAGKLR